MQTAEPGLAANEPLGHGWQPSPDLPNAANCGALPAAQGVQSVTAVATGLEVDAMNWVPAGQLVHLLSFASKNWLEPQIGLQSDTEFAPGLEVDGMNWVPVGHLAHSVADFKNKLAPQTQSESDCERVPTVVLPEAGQAMQPLLATPSE